LIYINDFHPFSLKLYARFHGYLSTKVNVQMCLKIPKKSHVFISNHHHNPTPITYYLLPVTYNLLPKQKQASRIIADP